MSDLLQLLTETGLIQFGRFPRDGTIVPIQFHLEMLASYPDVLHLAAGELTQKIPAVERLVCIHDTVPLGVALALNTGIPLVYSQGGAQDPVHDLVGAYDIGHPTVLITNVAGMTSHSKLLTSVRRVGLDVRSIMAVIDLGTASDLPITALLHLPEIVDMLVERDALPKGQARAVKDWIEAQITGQK